MLNQRIYHMYISVCISIQTNVLICASVCTCKCSTSECTSVYIYMYMCTSLYSIIHMYCIQYKKSVCTYLYLYVHVCTLVIPTFIDWSIIRAYNEKTVAHYALKMLILFTYQNLFYYTGMQQVPVRVTLRSFCQSGSVPFNFHTVQDTH